MLPNSPIFTRPGSESVQKETDQLVSRFTLPRDLKFTQWDGKVGTASELMDAMLAHCKQAFDDSDKTNWISLGKTLDITREYHVSKTQKQNNNRYFRYRGVLKAPPNILCCCLMEPHIVGEIDESVRHCRVLHNFPDGRTRLMNLVAEAGPRPLFLDRDDCALTTYYPPTKEEPDCWYQVSVTLPGHFPSVSTAVRNHTMYWGYRFQVKLLPNGETVTDTTLVSQTELFGWLPKFTVNAMISPILCAYLRSLESQGLRRLKEGDLLAQYGLQPPKM